MPLLHSARFVMGATDLHRAAAVHRTEHPYEAGDPLTPDSEWIPVSEAAAAMGAVDPYRRHPGPKVRPRMADPSLGSAGEDGGGMNGMGEIEGGWGAAHHVPSRWDVIPPEPPVYVPEAQRRRIAKAEEQHRREAGEFARQPWGPEAERLMQQAHDQLNAASSFAGVLRRRAESGDPPLASEAPMIKLTDEWLRRARALVTGLQRRRDVGLSPDDLRCGLWELAALERLNPDALPAEPDEPAEPSQLVQRMSVRSRSAGPGQPPREDLVRMEGGRFEYRADSEGDGGTLVGYAAMFNDRPPLTMHQVASSCCLQGHDLLRCAAVHWRRRPLTCA